MTICFVVIKKYIAKQNTKIIGKLSYELTSDKELYSSIMTNYTEFGEYLKRF